MRMLRGIKEIFYFSFYFTSLNVAGFLSFIRFIRGTQPPTWKKGDRLPQEVTVLNRDKKRKTFLAGSSSHSLRYESEVEESSCKKVSSLRHSSGSMR